MSNPPCVATAFVNIFAAPVLDLGKNASLCGVEDINLQANIAASSFLWSTGATAPSIVVNTAGVYWVRAYYDNCILSDTIDVTGGYAVIYVPNAFTPDYDGLNDVFMPKGEGITSYDLKIFTRWGQMIFELEDINKGWDGTVNGNPVQEGIYVWGLDYKTVCTGSGL